MRTEIEQALVNGLEKREARADELLAALQAAAGYMRNASIDLSTGCTKATAIRTIEGGIKLVEAAIAKAEGHPLRQPLSALDKKAPA